MSDQSGNPYGSTPGEGQEPNPNPYGQPPGTPYGQPSYGQPPTYDQPPAYGQQHPPHDPYGLPPTHSEPGQNPYGQPQQNPYGQSNPTNPYGGAPGYPQPGYPQPHYGMQQKEPQATTALVLGILGLVCCPFTGPFAWFVGQKSLNAIDASGGTLGGHGEAKAGQVLGIVGTIVLALVALLMFGFVTSFISAIGTAFDPMYENS